MSTVYKTKIVCYTIYKHRKTRGNFVMDTNEQKRKNLIKALNSSTKEERLASLKELIAFENANGLQPARRENDSNNHIHTIYSFSPYSPAAAAYMAYSAGLTSCGIMDHDSLSGSKEFAEACKMLGMGYTCGAEVRAKFNRRHWGKINHPDQEDCIYMSAHGVPAQNVDAFNAYLAGFRAKRELRDKKMVELINEKFAKFGISIDFQKDVYERSMAAEGGSISRC